MSLMCWFCSWKSKLPVWYSSNWVVFLFLFFSSSFYEQKKTLNCAFGLTSSPFTFEFQNPLYMSNSQGFHYWQLPLGVSLWLCDFPGGPDGKASDCNAGDLGSIPGSGKSPGGGHSNPLQYSCLENPTDRGAWQATQSMGSQRVGHDWVTNTHTVTLWWAFLLVSSLRVLCVLASTQNLTSAPTIASLAPGLPDQGEHTVSVTWPLFQMLPPSWSQRRVLTFNFLPDNFWLAPKYSIFMNAKGKTQTIGTKSYF